MTPRCRFHPDAHPVDGRCPVCVAESAFVTWDAPLPRVLRPAEPDDTDVAEPHESEPQEFRPYLPPPPVAPQIGCLAYGLAIIGFPVVFSGEDDAGGTPWTTLVAVVLVASVGGAGLAVGDGALAYALAYRGGDYSITSLVTAPFAHFGVLHLVGNLWFLAAFGRVVERWMGHAELAVLLALSGVLTTVLQALATDNATFIGGASGAVAAVLGATLIHAPQTRVAMSLGPVVRAAPMLLWGAIWFITQSVGFAAGSPGIGWVAHLSGFVLGVGFAIAMNLADMRNDASGEPMAP